MRRAKIQTEDGTILRAYLHWPGPGAHPGIIMCPGFGGVKPLIDTYAALFAEAGFAVLNYDQRGFGTSEGEPAGWLPYVTPKPLLMIIAEHDRCTFTEVQRAVYEVAPEPKKLLTFDGGHFDAYTMFFEQTGPPARDWFVEHLGTPRGGDAPGARESVSSTVSN
jgi:fermentation-respiration switch protein FrsA (DUF1100 family)